MTTTPIILRHATLDDLPALCHLGQLTDSQSWNVRTLTPEFKHPWSIFRVAELREPPPSLDPALFPPHSEEAIVAFCLCWHVPDEFQILNIATHPDFQGRGFAKRLIQDLLTHASLEGVAQVTLEVRPSNQAARGLYQRMGFQEVGRRRRYYRNPTEDGLLLSLLLHSHP